MHFLREYMEGDMLLMWRRCDPSFALRHDSIDERFGYGNIHVYTNCAVGKDLARNERYYDAMVAKGIVFRARRGDYEAIWEDVQHRLLNFIRLGARNRAALESLLEEHRGKFVVGLQVRIGLGNGQFLDNRRFLNDGDANTFVTYANYYTERYVARRVAGAMRQRELAGEFAGRRGGNEAEGEEARRAADPDADARRAKAEEEEEARARDNVVWFLSTDTARLEEEFRARFPGVAFSLSDLPLSHSGASPCWGGLLSCHRGEGSQPPTRRRQRAAAAPPSARHPLCVTTPV